jgi:hypothetical protein
MGYLDSFCVSFYDRFKDLLATSFDNVPSSPEKNHLKQSIASETKSLSLSKVSSQNLDFSDLAALKKSSIS